jgi:hypothetical protein
MVNLLVTLLVMFPGCPIPRPEPTIKAQPRCKMFLVSLPSHAFSGAAGIPIFNSKYEL